MDKMISLKCPECGATISVDGESERYVCEYCGSEFELDLSDDVRIESIRSKTYKEVELEKIKRDSEETAKAEAKEAIQEFKKGKPIKIIIGLMIVFGIASWMAFINFSPLAGIVGLIQIALLILALLNGFQIFKPGKQNHYVLFLIAAVVLILPFFALEESNLEHRLLYSDYYNNDSDNDTPEDIVWSDLKLGEMLPEPPISTGEVDENEDSNLDLTLFPMKESDMDSYMETCKTQYFPVDIYEPYDGRLISFNEDGYKLSLEQYGSDDDKLSISVLDPIEIKPIDWPKTGVGGNLPVPKSTVGNIGEESSDDFDAYVGETSKEDYDKYVRSCLDAGYDIDYDKGERSFSASNKQGDELEVEYYGNNIMSISVCNWHWDD